MPGHVTSGLEIRKRVLLGGESQRAILRETRQEVFPPPASQGQRTRCYNVTGLTTQLLRTTRGTPAAALTRLCGRT